MPLAVAIPYFVIEALAFWGVSQLIGVGYALLLLFITFFVGLIFAAWEMRRIAVNLAQGTIPPGQAAGNIGLTSVGALAIAMPGFVSTILGLLLIIPPTRAVIRRLLARKLREKLENIGAKSFERTYQFRNKSQYGSFAGNVIDVEPVSDAEPTPDAVEISQWASSVSPEDFGTPRTNSEDSSKNSDKDNE